MHPFVLSVMVGAIRLADENGNLVSREEATVRGAVAGDDFGCVTVFVNDVEKGCYKRMGEIDVGHGFEEADVHGHVRRKESANIFKQGAWICVFGVADVARC